MNAVEQQRSPSTYLLIRMMTTCFSCAACCRSIAFSSSFLTSWPIQKKELLRTISFFIFYFDCFSTPPTLAHSPELWTNCWYAAIYVLQINGNDRHERDRVVPDLECVRQKLHQHTNEQRVKPSRLFNFDSCSIIFQCGYEILILKWLGRSKESYTRFAGQSLSRNELRKRLKKTNCRRLFPNFE